MASKSGLSLHITIYIDRSNVSKFFQHFEPVYKAVIAEPKCLSFEVFQSPEDPGTISWVENWDATQEWLMEEQITKEYYKAYFEATEPMFVKEREVKIYDRVGPSYFYVAKETR